MQEMSLVAAFILGIVEGLTEFLPVSSTGHLILAGDLFGVNDAKGKVFEIVIQTGAMLAIVWEYRARFGRVLAGLWSDRAAQRFAANLLVAFIPAAVLGLSFGSLIKAHLFSAIPVALAFIGGGLVILWVERGGPGTASAARVQEVDDMTWSDALKVGCAQCFALIPGTSRSGATIIGGMIFGLSRRAATEFSFFLAVPTLVAAGGYDLLKNRALFSTADVSPLAVGLIVSFASAWLCVRWLIRYIATHDFRPFAWYRIAFGLAVLFTAYAGVVRWSAG
ncbi:MAG: undecaprenyl-diphosphate phosphatase [Betaproteobacteria bacterium]|nr:undecaprenyl-diphosphate phosphatase [Betaproteobacteria bacterium]